MMSALLMYLKQPSCIYCAYLWLATLAVVNAQEVLQPKPGELQILNEDTGGLHFLADQGNIKYPDKDFVPKTRNDFLQYSLRLTLDLNTVSGWIRLFESNRLMAFILKKLPSYPDHPDRFDHWPQVLCRESVSDRRSYWEVEWSGDNGVLISVSYKSICRKGRDRECVFGLNDLSWILYCDPDIYRFGHNKRKISLPVKPIRSRTGVFVDDYDVSKNISSTTGVVVDYYRVGVFVDHSAGTLSFYSVSGDTMTLIHTVQTTFTQPLYPGFHVSHGTKVKL